MALKGPASITGIPINLDSSNEDSVAICVYALHVLKEEAFFSFLSFQDNAVYTDFQWKMLIQ